MSAPQVRSTLQFPRLDARELALMAEAIAFAARAGDTFALEGDLGAGKTTFARAMIRALLEDQAAEIPSPTFSLIQTYDAARMSAAHCDLYRLNDPSELDELGLDHALNDGIAIVEWPARAAGALPADCLEITLEDPGGEASLQFRNAELFPHGHWEQRVHRLAALIAFVLDHDKAAGGQDIHLSYLQGDASVRRYGRLVSAGGANAVLMDWPKAPDGPPIAGGLPYSRIAHLAEGVHPFVAIADVLRNVGLRTPRIYAQDLDNGLLLLEDFGDRVFGAELDRGGDQRELWRAAIDVLLALRLADVPGVLPLPDGDGYVLNNYDQQAQNIEIELLVDWYWPHVHDEVVPGEARAAFMAAWAPILDSLNAAPRRFVLRDFHSPNLLWMPDAGGLARVGVIDFQDALKGHPAYDLVSLLQDARVDVPTSLEAGLFDDYCRAASAQEQGFDREEFEFAYAALGAQRNTKILGIFARLARRDGKPGYLRHMPRIWRYLERDLNHPQLRGLKDWYDTHFDKSIRTISP